MLKALIKKEFAELGAAYQINKKTGKRRSKGGITGLIILFVFAGLSMGAAFFGMGMLFSEGFSEKGLDWLYFAMMGLIAVAFATIGEVFATYSALYKPKDNELLLAMPIPARTILLARMTTLYLMSVIFTAVVFLPALLAWWINCGAGALSVIFSILLIFVLALVALLLACFLGWIVALIASKIRGNKAVISVIVSVALITVYYVVYFRMNKLLRSAVDNAEAIAQFIKTRLFPFYHFGLAALGSPLYMLLFTAGTVALFAVVWILIAKNFIKLVTNERQAKKAALRGDEIKAGSASGALIGREFKHFTSSAAYMLNCGLGLIIAVAASIFALIKSDAIRTAVLGITQNTPMLLPLIPCAVVAGLMFTLGMNLITAPSVSLEGNGIWIVQSMPVDTKKILRAKLLMHIILNGIAGLVCGILLSLALGLTAGETAAAVACVLGFTVLMAYIGLAINLKKPMLDWTNETVPIKQGASVVFAMLTGMGITGLFVGLAFVFSMLTGAVPYLLGFLVIELGVALLIRRWVMSRGAEIFAKLQ